MARFNFDLQVERNGGRARVAVSGELDLGTAGRLERCLAELLERREAVLLDLRELTFMDSTGVRLLLQFDAEARSDGFSFAILDCEGPVRRVLTLTGVAHRLAHAQP
jgi:anti-sigma B factor antagonist